MTLFSLIIKNLLCASAMLLATMYGLSQAPLNLSMGVAQNSFGSTVAGELVITGAESLNRPLRYSDMKGSPFYEDQFKWARVYDFENRLLGTGRCRINLYTNEVHYLSEKNEELSLGVMEASRVDFLNGANSDEVKYSFIKNDSAINTKLGSKKFLMELNKGEYRLLKDVQKIVNQYDSSMGQYKKYMFVTKHQYYLVRLKSHSQLQRLGQEKILAFTKNDDLLLKRIAQDKLNLKKEEDVVVLLNHLNANYVH